jgi:phytoene desaturase
MAAAAGDARPHAIVIGSGFGGLAAAIRLGAKGYRVTVLEKLDGPGGRAYVFKQDGFSFDSGPTIITAPWLLEELWALCGKRFADDVDLRPMDPFYDVRFDDGTVFSLSGDREKMKAEIAKFSPEDAPRFDAFMDHCEKVYDYGFATLAEVSFDKLSTMLAAVPRIMGLGGYRTVFGLVSKYIKHPKLRIALSLHPLLIGGNPYAVTAIYCLINHLEGRYGVHFAMGGTGRLVEAMAGLIEGQGNHLRCGAEVERISVTDGRADGVVLTSGERIAADVVVSNADAAWTYAHLLGKGTRKRWTPGKLNRMRYSMGLFVWYFGTDRRYEDVPHHSMILGARYRGLLRDIFSRKRLADDFSLYLHRPTATDPALAPDGCDAFYALVPCPHLDADIDWSVHGPRYRDLVCRRLEETVMPDLGRHVVSERFVTPVDFERRLNSYKGAGFGPEPVIWQSAWFRAHNISEEVANLYMVGASTHPGAGIPGVITSAKVAVREIPDACPVV